MRDYILHESQTRAAYGLVGLIKRRIENWRARKDLRTLLRFSDYQLRDVGLTRAGLRALLQRPADCDLMWELDRQNVAADTEAMREMASAPAESTSPKARHFGKTALEKC